MSELALQILGLDVTLPNGRALFRALDLEVRSGEVVAILGGSGAGKSTLARVLFQREELEREGFSVAHRRLEAHGGLGLVPQRGALFDHLDVAGNLALAQRHGQKAAASNSGDLQGAILRWLKAVDLPAALAERGTPVAQLSGGQAQRVAVARTLASGSRLIFCDEPSVGLDPERVSTLARLLRQTARNGAALVVVTHDLDLACAVADRLLFLDPAAGKLSPLCEETWAGPNEAEANADADQRQLLEGELRRRLDAAKQGGAPSPRIRPRRRLLAGLLGATRVPGQALLSALKTARFGRDALRVFFHALKAAALRPAPFYLIVSAILGYTVLYVISRAMPAGLRVDRTIELVGGSYILALTPPLSALIFAATSGSAISAWLGSMGLTGQITALRALGISRSAYLDTPSWLALLLSYLLTAAIFAAGMTLGGAALAIQQGVADPWPLLLGDLVDPHPSRWMLRHRALWLIGLYSAGIGAEVVYRATRMVRRSEDVTRAMTASVIVSTLWVVLLELGTAALVFAR